jgi:hypothetical protein
VASAWIILVALVSRRVDESTIRFFFWIIRGALGYTGQGLCLDGLAMFSIGKYCEIQTGPTPSNFRFKLMSKVVDVRYALYLRPS